MIYKVILSIILHFVSIGLYAQTIVLPQVFTIKNNIDTIIITEYGTQVKIERNSIETSDTSMNLVDEYSIHIREVIDNLGAVVNQVSTNSNRGILISNGMLYITAYVGDQELELRSDRKIEIRTPVSAGNFDMGLYSISSTDEWTKMTSEISLDTCPSFIMTVLTYDSIVDKNSYRVWQKKNNRVDGLFGGTNRPRQQVYTIPIPYDTVWNCDNNELSYYNFNIQDFGWYNIDKLAKIRKPRSMSVVCREGMRVIALVDKKNIVIRFNESKSEVYHLSNYPSTLGSTVISYKTVEDDKVLFSVYSMKKFRSRLNMPEPNVVSNAEFRKIIRQLH
ncbi:hypothetical protein [Lewinella sp. 4G2]|uniref:hypothetical protein n=2 Tax=Lewinella sp. 4G2 TaxID=1803372 RepID=UPI0007DF2644|nr:hypothetical protein [Lewinella sp. 4G2]OAV45118.1 hypothetical protein A3850_011735 [Lewinella sp. 4G2]